MSAFDTDFEALGLSDHSPFAILSRPKATPAELQPKRSVGRPSQTTRDKTIRALQDNTANNFCTPIQTTAQSYRTRAIGGGRCE